MDKVELSFKNFEVPTSEEWTEDNASGATFASLVASGTHPFGELSL